MPIQNNLFSYLADQNKLHWKQVKNFVFFSYENVFSISLKSQQFSTIKSFANLTLNTRKTTTRVTGNPGRNLDRHKDVVVLNRLIGSLGNWISFWTTDEKPEQIHFN